MRHFIVGLFIGSSLLCSAHAQIVQIGVTSPRGAVSGACHRGVVAPGISRSVHPTAYHPDRVVGRRPVPCCPFTCTQALSITRLEPPRKPGRT